MASLKLALVTVVISLLVGVPGALVLDRFELPGKTAFRRLVLLPLILPGIITGVALLTFFSFVGLSLSSGFPLVPGWPVVLGHSAALTSVVITQVFARLQRFDRALEEASQDLYANEWQTFWYITLPDHPDRSPGRRPPGVHAESRRDRGHLFPHRPAEHPSVAHLGAAAAWDNPGSERRRDRHFPRLGRGDRRLGQADARA